MSTEFLQAVDAEELKRIEERGAAKSIKRHWIKEGYDQQLSIYGVHKNRETGEESYNRIEILSNTLYTERIVALIYEFFYIVKIPSPYTIWIYDGDRDSIRPVGAYQ